MKRNLELLAAGPIGLGCMSLSHAYGTPPERAHASTLLNDALDAGYRHLDTAALYGFGANESLIGEAVSHRRQEYFLASKCGLTAVDGKRTIDGRPETLLRTVDESLKRLRTDHIDLYYLHRWDKKVPIEESVGAMARMIEAGKIGAIGLSEVSAATLLKAHTEHPIAAVQNEYSLWSRNAELGILEATRNIGATLVAFSPLARGFLAGALSTPDQLLEKDLRRAMPRFAPENFARNLALLQIVQTKAKSLGITPAQLCLAWLLSRGSHVLPIPGTTSNDHMRENIGSPTPLAPADVADLDSHFAPQNIAGARYAATTLAEIDTEEF